MRKFLLLAVLLCAVLSVRSSEIDNIVARKLAPATPSEVCGDEVFVRRVHITLTGRLPKASDAATFLADKSADKRAKLIDRLLDSEEYVDYQVMKWGDLLRIKSEFPSNLWPNPANAYNRWLREQLRADTPYDRFVTDLLVCSGSNSRDPQVNFYRGFQNRSPKSVYDNVALLFMGTRNAPEGGEHFFSQIKYKNTSEWKDEIVYIDPLAIPDEIIGLAYFPDGKSVRLPRTKDDGGYDLRAVFAKWLTSAENPYFARCMANRLWSWVMGRGIIHEPDNICLTTPDENPPTNPELLKYLETEFLKGGYSIKGLYRLILNSDTYQRSSLPNASNASDVTLFSHFIPVRLNAESLIDAFCEITGVYDYYMSRVPEPYSYFPDDMTAIRIGDGTVTLSQLELFGRPSRDVSYENDRNNDVSSRQILYLVNSSQLYSKIAESPSIAEMLKKHPSLDSYATQIYLSMLSRYPSAGELKVAREYRASTGDDRKTANNLVWALFNSKEFLFNH